MRLRRIEEVKPYRSQFLSEVVDESEHCVVVAQPYHPIVPQTASFVQVVRLGKVWIPAANTSKQAVKLHAGTLLAKYEAVEQTQLEEAGDGRITRIMEAMGPDNDFVRGSMSCMEKLQQLLEQKDWSHLSQEQREQVERLIVEHEESFIVEKGELGLIQQAPAHIQVDDPTPCRSHIYRYPEQAKATIAAILKDLEERDIIEKSTAASLSPIVLVSKPSGHKRMCLVYSKVNKQLTNGIHPLSNLEKLVE